jgi:hypothetical protein
VKKNHDMNKWKHEQLEYFKQYLNAFDIDSKEYRLILKEIRELEQSS